MDWRRYKQLCDRPDTFSRWMLEQTEAVLERLAETGTEEEPAQGEEGEEAEEGGKGDVTELRRLLREARESPPLPKPADHKGGAATDMFVLQLERAEAARICAAVAAAARHGLYGDGTRRRGLGGFLEAWEEYRRWLPTTG